MSIELLEPRIAPASVLRFMDVDGDHVVITTTAGDLTAVTHPAGGGVAIDTLDATHADESASIHVRVFKGPHGDGSVRIGLLDAHGVSLDQVVIQGDLGSVLAGEGGLFNTTPAIEKLVVRNLGSHSVSSHLAGHIDDLVVRGQIQGGKLEIDGLAASDTLLFQHIRVAGNVTNWEVTGFDGDFYGTIKVAGSWIHSSIDGFDSFSGQNESALGGQSVSIAGSVRAGFFGTVNSFHAGGSVTHTKLLNAGNVSIGGAAWLLVAGADHFYLGGAMHGGAVFANSILIAGSVRDAKVGTEGSVSIGGDVVSSFLTGKNARIGGSMIGGAVHFDFFHDGLGGDYASMASLSIGRDLVAATVETVGAVAIGGSFYYGQIHSLRSIHIHGSMIGGQLGDQKLAGLAAGHPPVFSYSSSLSEIKIDGSVGNGARILGKSIGRLIIHGDFKDGLVRSDGRIAKVQVDGSMIAGRIVAGNAPDPSTDSFQAAGSIGAVYVGGNLGRADTKSDFAGSIVSFDGSIGFLFVGGSVAGGTASHSGWVYAPDGISVVTVGKGIRRGAGPHSGVIETQNAGGAVAIPANGDNGDGGIVTTITFSSGG